MFGDCLDYRELMHRREKLDKITKEKKKLPFLFPTLINPQIMGHSTKQQPFLSCWFFTSHFAQYNINQWHSLSEDRETKSLMEFRKALDIYDKTTIPDFIWSFSSLKVLLQSSLQNSGSLFPILQTHKNITGNKTSKGL